MRWSVASTIPRTVPRSPRPSLSPCWSMLYVPLPVVILFVILFRYKTPTNSSLQGFLVFCGLQGLLHMRENRRGAIAL